MNQTTKQQIDKMTARKMEYMMKTMQMNCKYFVGETGIYFSKSYNTKKGSK